MWRFFWDSCILGSRYTLLFYCGCGQCGTSFHYDYISFSVIQNSFIIFVHLSGIYVACVITVYHFTKVFCSFVHGADVSPASQKYWSFWSLGFLHAMWLFCFFTLHLFLSILLFLHVFANDYCILQLKRLDKVKKMS